MRLAIRNLIVAGLKLLEGGNPATFIYRDGRYPCVATTERRGAIVISGGVEYEVSLSLLVRKAATPGIVYAMDEDISVDWAAQDVLTAGAGSTPTAYAPFAARRIGKDNRLYRIISVNDNPSGSHWTIDLTDARK